MTRAELIQRKMRGENGLFAALLANPKFALPAWWTRGQHWTSDCRSTHR